MLTVILTQNEQANLPACLAAIPERYPIVIVDTGSTDNTLAIANSRGLPNLYESMARFCRAAQLCHQSMRHRHAMAIVRRCRDEIYPQAFYDWFKSGMADAGSFDVLMVPSILYLRGKRLNHAPGYPIYHPRLVRRETAPLCPQPHRARRSRH